MQPDRTSTAAQSIDNPRFWKVVHAWCVGQLTDSEFIAVQAQTVGFVWLNPVAP